MIGGKASGVCNCQGFRFSPQATAIHTVSPLDHILRDQVIHKPQSSIKRDAPSTNAAFECIAKDLKKVKHTFNPDSDLLEAPFKEDALGNLPVLNVFEESVHLGAVDN